MSLTASQQPLPDNPTAHLLYQVLSELGWDTHDAEALAARVRRLALGLPAEDEFSVILNWLGNCRLIHKLDQLQMPPASAGQYRVPDLLAIFEYQGRELPVLIEVKTSEKSSLSWRPDVFQGLRRYGQVLGLPVLVAWRARALGVWCLVDLGRFERARKNYKLPLKTALQGNLLGVLGGDFMVAFEPGLELRFRFKTIQTLGTEAREDGTTERLLLKVVDACFVTPTGERVTKLGPGLWPLFLAAQHEEETIATDDGYQLGFVISPNRFGAWAHVTLVTLLSPGGGTDTSGAPFPWREVLQQQRFPLTPSALTEAAEKGIEQGTVRHVLRQLPDVMPTFLGNRS